MRMGHILQRQVLLLWHPFLLGMWLNSQTRRTRKVVVMIVMIVMTLFRSVHHLQQNRSFLCTWSAMGPCLVWCSLAVLAIWARSWGAVACRCAWSRSLKAAPLIGRQSSYCRHGASSKRSSICMQPHHATHTLLLYSRCSEPNNTLQGFHGSTSGRSSFAVPLMTSHGSPLSTWVGACTMGLLGPWRILARHACSTWTLWTAFCSRPIVFETVLTTAVSVHPGERGQPFGVGHPLGQTSARSSLASAPGITPMSTWVVGAMKVCRTSQQAWVAVQLTLCACAGFGRT